jgi:CHAD domain-containing protein
MDGVRQARDIECVHRMRVASRRLRTALRLFEKCFPGKPFRRWQREMRAITRALGRARDLDVQIEFVRKFERSRHDARNRPGVKRLLLRLCQKRERAQRKVLRRLADFQASGVSESMAAVLSPLVIQGTGQAPSPGLLQDVREWSQRGLGELLKYEPYVTQPRAVKELHALRIAAKHLRYMLEIFEPLFAQGKGSGTGGQGSGSSLQAPLKAAKQIQVFLGTLHDCDVWLEFLPRFLDRESKRSLDYHGHDRAFRRLAPGIEHFRLSVLRLRRRTYRRFAAGWQEMRSNRVWESLQATVRGEP